ncbi:anthrone oxygenase family protein [Micromonospora sp. NBC_01638]|uniref:anthrone oxygenase family protein n=1 Tax=Micromonospora sp. NBC_01638 TaxID=2975982 RepID=UPI00386FBB2E|nr:DUF1772 domain-containing protein [Micromonospora sp. NBC_01638]
MTDVKRVNKRTQKVAETRRRILEAARNLFVGDDEPAATMKRPWFRDALAAETERMKTIMSVRPVTGLALLSTGLLAGAFGYGAVNVQTTFNAVPLDVRLTFHSALMQMNGPVMQTTMALAALSSLALAVLTRRTPRFLAGAAGALAVASFLITRFGNVPINGQIKVWAVTTPPADYAATLQRWEMFNVARTLTALAAFVLIITLALRTTRVRQAGHQPELPARA